MAVRVGVLWMSATFKVGRCLSAFFFEICLGFADEIGFTGAYLSGIFEDVSKGASHLPGRVGTGPWSFAQPLLPAQLHVFHLFLSRSHPNSIDFAPSIIPKLALFIFDENSSLH